MSYEEGRYQTMIMDKPMKNKVVAPAGQEFVGTPHSVMLYIRRLEKSVEELNSDVEQQAAEIERLKKKLEQAVHICKDEIFKSHEAKQVAEIMLQAITESLSEKHQKHFGNRLAYLMEEKGLPPHQSDN